MIAFRKDIDGMRAVAVLMVVLYHCGFERIFPGGYIGVDVFFVISGYLITKIVYTEAQAQTFSIWNFYERRIRRIFPAIIVVYAFVIIASFFLLMPDELSQQIRNTLSSILFVSNIYFYSTTNYFDAAAEFNAVLHTWSLSVEEQFYIFFPPLLLLICKRYPNYLKPVLVITALVSLVASQFAVSINPSSAFYLVHYRAWELLIGSIVAVGVAPSCDRKVINNLASVAGLGLVGMSAFLLTRTSSFPGVSALPACIGCGLVIWSGTRQTTWAGYLLGWKPVQFVGRVSYSLYLWHWPVWVLGHQFFEPRNPLERLAFVGASFTFAVLSYFLVEQPFRRQKQGVSAQRSLAIGTAAMSCIALLAAVLPGAGERYWQVSAHVKEVAAFIKYKADKEFRIGKCFLTSEFNKFEMYEQDFCLKRSDVKKNVLIFGDSHAAHFYPGLLHQTSINVLQATASGCRPIEGTTGEARCTDMVHFITDIYLPNTAIDTVILSAHWADGDEVGLNSEIKLLRKYVPQVIVFGPITEYDQALPRVLATSLYRDDEQVIVNHRLLGPKALDRKFALSLGSSGATYVSVYDTLCPESGCLLWTDDNHPIQSDTAHLTARGSETMVARILENFDFRADDR